MTKLTEPLGYDVLPIMFDERRTRTVRFDRSIPLACDQVGQGLLHFQDKETTMKSRFAYDGPEDVQAHAHGADKLARIKDICRAAGLDDDDIADVLAMCFGDVAPGAGRDEVSAAQAKAETSGVLSAMDYLAMDSAAQVYGAALRQMGVSTAGVNRAAYRDIFLAERAVRRRKGQPMVAMDFAASKSLADRFPHAAGIGNLGDGRGYDAW